MALNIDPNVFTGGAVRFDARPHTQLYIQLMQRKQAQNEAFDEYLRNLNKSINSAGLRNVDRPAFDKKLQDWQKFAMENRDAIRQRKGGADILLQQGYQDIMNLVAESKQEEEKKKPLIEILTDPAKRDRLSEDIFPELEAHDQPIYGQDGQRNPNRKSFDVKMLNFDPKPFEQDKYFKQFEDVKRSDLTPTVVKNPKEMTQTVTTTSVFDPEAKNTIALRATTDYVNNKEFKHFIDKLNPAEYNDFYKSNYGHDIQSAADLAAAYTLKGMQQKVTTSKLEDDTFARQKEMENIRQKNREHLALLNQNYRLAAIDYRGNKDTKEKEGILNSFIEKQINDPTALKGDVSYEGNKYKGTFVKMPKFMTDEYSVNEGSKDNPKWKDPEWIITEDKKYIVPVYKTGKKTGTGAEYVTKDSKPILIEDYKARLAKEWLTKSQTAEELTDEFDDDPGTTRPRTQASSIPSATRSEWKEAGWSDAQIKQGVKDGKIKVTN